MWHSLIHSIAFDMACVRVLILTVIVSFFLQLASGEKKCANTVFKDFENLDYFAKSMVRNLVKYDIIKYENEEIVLTDLKRLIISKKGKRISRIEKSLAIKIVDIISESIDEDANWNYSLGNAVQAIACSFQENTFPVDEGFIKLITRMITAIYDNEDDNTIMDTNTIGNVYLPHPKPSVRPASEYHSLPTPVTSRSSNTIIAASDSTLLTSESSQVANAATQESKAMLHMSSAATAKAKTSTINYEIIGNYLRQSLSKSNVFSGVSTGTLSMLDIKDAVASTLISNGVQASIAKSVSTQCISAGTSSTDMISGISLAVSQSLSQSNVVTLGQEISISKTISSSIISCLKSLMSRRNQLQPAMIQTALPSAKPLPSLLPMQTVKSSAAVPESSSASVRSSDSAFSSTVSSTSSKVSTTQIKESSTASQVSSAHTSTTQAISVDYKLIQRNVRDILLKSYIFGGLRNRLFLTADLIRIVSETLVSYGVQHSIAKSVSSQYISSTVVGPSFQAIASAISLSVSKSLCRSSVVQTGDEVKFSQKISSSLISSMNELSTPPQPAPVKIPITISHPVTATSVTRADAVSKMNSAAVASSDSTYSATAASASSSATNSAFVSSKDIKSVTSASALMNSVATSVSPLSADHILTGGNLDGPRIKEPATKILSPIPLMSTSHPTSTSPPTFRNALTSSVAAQRISSVKSAIRARGINVASVASALSQDVNQIRKVSSLSENEVLCEALLETLAAVMQCLSPAYEDSATIMSHSLRKIMGRYSHDSMKI